MSHRAAVPPLYICLNFSEHCENLVKTKLNKSARYYFRHWILHVFKHAMRVTRWKQHKRNYIETLLFPSSSTKDILNEPHDDQCVECLVKIFSRKRLYKKTFLGKVDEAILKNIIKVKCNICNICYNARKPLRNKEKKKKNKVSTDLRNKSEEKHVSAKEIDLLVPI